jgi:3-isopropylmalate/(R)-2-methylmalate dehydratase large subunit
MGLTMTEKILARHAGRTAVEPGENIWVDVDVLLTHDVCGPGTIGVLKSEFGPEARVWDPEKVVIIPDHYIFTADEKAHRNIDILRDFAKDQKLPHYYDVGTERYRGVCHVALPAEGHARPGEVLFGTDSHTCTHGAFGLFATGIGNTDAGFVMATGKLWVKVPPTMRFVFAGELPPYLMAKDLILHIIGDIGVDGATYRAMEFAGDTIEALSVDERMTICNMAIEAGGKNGIIAPDDKPAIMSAPAHPGRNEKYLEEAFNDADARFFCEKVYPHRRPRAGGGPASLARQESPGTRCGRDENHPQLHRVVYRRQGRGLPGCGAGAQRPDRGSRDLHHSPPRPRWTPRWTV